MEFRRLMRNGRCSVCYSSIKKNGEEVLTLNSPKHHKLVVICNECLDKIIKERK